MKPLHRLFVLLTIGLIAGAIVGVLQIKNATLRADTSYADPAMKGVKIGGAFELTDHTGKNGDRKKLARSVPPPLFWFYTLP